jgi:hypothetical protein
MIFDLTAVEDLLRGLGMIRASMTPEVPPRFAMGQKVETIPDPAWVAEPDLMQGDSIIHLRDPRYGWLHYLIPRSEAAKLAGFLQKQVETPIGSAVEGSMPGTPDMTTRVLDVPYVQQVAETACGAAAFEMVLKFFRPDATFSQAEMYQRLKQAEPQGSGNTRISVQFAQEGDQILQRTAEDRRSRPSLRRTGCAPHPCTRHRTLVVRRGPWRR